MEKFKWIDFDPVADGKVKPKGIIVIETFCSSSLANCQVGVECGGGELYKCYDAPDSFCPGNCYGPRPGCG